jgi:hypothetical protein
MVGALIQLVGLGDVAVDPIVLVREHSRWREA